MSEQSQWLCFTVKHVKRSFTHLPELHSPEHILVHLLVSHNDCAITHLRTVQLYTAIFLHHI